MPLSIQHQADSAGDKAVSLIADNSGSNVAAAFKGVNKATQNGDTVADLVVSLDSETVDLTIQKTEDAAHSSGDKGIMALAVRKDTATALAGADGDYAPLEVDVVGALHTRDRAGYADNDTFTRGTSRLLAGLAGIYESTVSSLTAGRVALARLTSRGAVVTARDFSSIATTWTAAEAAALTLKQVTLPANASSMIIMISNSLDSVASLAIYPGSGNGGMRVTVGSNIVAGASQAWYPAVAGDGVAYSTDSALFMPLLSIWPDTSIRMGPTNCGAATTGSFTVTILCST